jgi:hypothetical protein
MALFLYAVIICLRKGTEAVFVSLFSFFTASAIISSFIISYDFPADISARFFVGAVCFAIVMVVLAFSCTKKVAIALVFPLYIASSLYSYQVNTTPLYDQEKQTYDYIAFLKRIISLSAMGITGNYLTMLTGCRLVKSIFPR